MQLFDTLSESTSEPIDDAGTTRQSRRQTADLLAAVQAAGEDFEWYPTTPRMIGAVGARIRRKADCRNHTARILDVGAGDGRVLAGLAAAINAGRGVDDRNRICVDLYAIERSAVLVQAQPEAVTPIGTELFEQNLACLPVDYVFSNPPYAEFERWAEYIIDSAHARMAWLVLPRRWAESDAIAAALKRRGATAKSIHDDDFADADRRARAVIQIVEIAFPTRAGYHSDEPQDPFDLWFDQNVGVFDAEPDDSYSAELRQEQAELARLRSLDTVAALVAEYDQDYARMEQNYRAIFKLDGSLLRELGVKKDALRDGIKLKMTGLKARYWRELFNRLAALTDRLATGPKQQLLRRLTGVAGEVPHESDRRHGREGRPGIAFTAGNCYAVVLWAIKHANAHFNQQTVDLFRALSTADGVMNYKSNQRTWGRDDWRYTHPDDAHRRPSHYALDYRIVRPGYSAIMPAGSYRSYESPGGLHNSAHELIDDCIAVLHNLGFPLSGCARSRDRQWEANKWQDFTGVDGELLFQVKGFIKGNLHLRFRPAAIRALNVEAGRLLGWLRSPREAADELGIPEAEAEQYFNATRQFAPSAARLLLGDETEPAAQAA